MLDGEYIINQIYDIWKNPDKYDLESIIAFLQDLSNFTEDILKEPRKNLLESALEDMKEEYGFCPKCKEPIQMSPQNYYEDHSELDELGYHFKEQMCYKECPKCEYTTRH